MRTLLVAIGAWTFVGLVSTAQGYLYALSLGKPLPASLRDLLMIRGLALTRLVEQCILDGRLERGSGPFPRSRE